MKKDYLISMNTSLCMVMEDLKDFLDTCGDESNSDYDPVFAADELVRDTMGVMADWGKSEEACRSWPEQISDFEKVYNDLRAARGHLEEYNDRSEIYYGETDARIDNALYNLEKAIKTAETKI